MGTSGTSRANAVNSADYYDQNAESFIAQTRQADMSEHYARFLEHIPAGGSIIDAGSGSGRDAKWFKDQGYAVEAFDASPAMVKATEEFADVSTRLMTFEDFSWDCKVDGIWACASLLHIRPERLTDALSRLLVALKPHGVIYCSFKYGSKQRTVNGRYFNDLQETLLSDAVDTVYASVASTWTTGDVRLDRPGELWLNALIKH